TEEGQRNMCRFVEEEVNKAHQQGVKQGVEKGVLKSLRELVSYLMNNNNGLSEEETTAQAKRMLNIQD
ncbi:MAG: hypothetical protein ACSW8F_05640, partial [bacterium]